MNTPNTKPSVDRPPDRVSQFLSQPHQLFIAGAWTDAESEQTIDVINPGTGQVVAQAQAGGSSDINRAVRAARVAIDEGPWPRMAPTERSRLMFALADAVEAATDEVSCVETINHGMPLHA